MQVKILEIRDRGTFIPVICVRPMPDNDAQRYLLRRDGWSCDPADRHVYLIDTHRRRAIYSPYDWPGGARTFPVAHKYIEEHWDELADGDVIDVEFIEGETVTKKVSERFTETV